MRTTIAALTFSSLMGSAQASTLTAVGAVNALTDINQVFGVVRTGNFDEGPTSGNIPLDPYSAQGLTCATGTLSSILAGVTTPGSAINPVYKPPVFGYFPPPIGGGGSQVAQISYYASVATFTVGKKGPHMCGAVERRAPHGKDSG